VVYDHFLATDTNEFTVESLEIFSEDVYRNIDKHQQDLPERFARMFPYMKLQNWLFNYRTLAGTELSFGGVVRRARYLDESKTAAILFEENYKALQACYRSFFPDLKSFARRMFEEL